MDDDLQTRLDRAITEARTDVMIAQTDDRLDGYAALVAVRARLAECAYMRVAVRAAREHDLTAEAERLLSGEAG